jgi:hypothetical protein
MTFQLWLKDTLERALSTFVLFGLTLLAGGAALDISFAHQMATAGLAAAFVVVKQAFEAGNPPSFPNPYLDALARAGWSFVQAAFAVLVAAGSGWLDVSVWQGAIVAGVAAAASVLKGLIAVKAQPDTITPASFAKAA